MQKQVKSKDPYYKNIERQRETTQRQFKKTEL